VKKVKIATLALRKFFQIIDAALFCAALFGNKKTDNKRLGL